MSTGLLPLMVVTVGLTELVELPLAALLGLRTPAGLALLAAANAVTNPALNISMTRTWSAFPGMGLAATLAVLAAAEVMVVLLEWLVLRGHVAHIGVEGVAPAAQCLALVVAVNAASAGVGMALLWP